MTTANILIVEDQPDSRLILEDMLTPEFRVVQAASGEEALERLAGGEKVDLILLDVLMPGINGYEVCRRLKADAHLRSIPVLFLTGLQSAEDETRGFTLGAEDFIHKPLSPPVVLARVRTHLHLAQAQQALRLKNEDLEILVAERTGELMRRNRDLINVQGATITAFCALAEARDNETGNHIRRTQNYVRALAEHLKGHPRFSRELNDEAIDLLHKSAPLHDVGKVAIPDRILLKPGKLTPEEWVIMMRHTEFGRDAIAQTEQGRGESVTFLHYAREIAYSHHEKWDGSGYPQGLSGEAIPLSARLMAVADVYDALISKRVYKPAFTHELAVAMMVEGRGRHFDPDIADAMVRLEGEFARITQTFSDETGECR